MLARALQLWLGGRLAVILRKGLVRSEADHVVLSLPDPEGVIEPLYLDADGVTTAFSLLTRWNLRERLAHPVLEDPADHARLISSVKDEVWSAWLAEQFEAQFGKLQWLDLENLLGRMD